MARLTIEDCWWTDPRRDLLAESLGGNHNADVVAVRAWRLAQDFWKRGQGLVPKSLFDALKHAAELLSVGLADIRGDAVYIRGSADYLDWLNEARKSGQVGGRKSAQRPRDEKGRLLPKETPSETQATSKQHPSDSKPLSLSLTKYKETTLVDKSTNPLLEIWNQNRGTLPLARECSSSSKRGRAAAVRWREHPDATYWTEVVRRLAASPFCRGETERGTWRASFDFLVQPDTHIKALEGKYDAPARKPKLNTTPIDLETL